MVLTAGSCGVCVTLGLSDDLCSSPGCMQGLPDPTLPTLERIEGVKDPLDIDDVLHRRRRLPSTLLLQSGSVLRNASSTFSPAASDGFKLPFSTAEKHEDEEQWERAGEENKGRKSSSPSCDTCEVRTCRWEVKERTTDGNSTPESSDSDLTGAPVSLRESADAESLPFGSTFFSKPSPELDDSTR